MTEPLDDEALLSRFREWLREARLEAEARGSNGDLRPPPIEPGPEVGLYRLVEEFTALRHEVKLETKGSRGLQEQVEALLPAFRQAIDQFRSVGPKEEQAAQAAGRPLAEAVAELDEALDRGRLEVEKARARAEAESAALVGSIQDDLDALYRAQPWARRVLGLKAYHPQARELVGRRLKEGRPALLEALLEGYDLIRARLRKAMDAGRPVDPDRMTVVEAVDAPGTPPGHVVDEVRRGYTWRGRVLRFVEVRAARERAGRPEEAQAEVGLEDQADRGAD